MGELSTNLSVENIYFSDNEAVKTVINESAVHFHTNS